MKKGFIVILVITAFLLTYKSQSGESAPKPVVINPDQYTPDELNNINIYNNSVLSVVHISSIQQVRRGFNYYNVKSDTGSGFVWDKEGHIITNYHVIKNAKRFVVSFHQDNNQYEAEVIGASPYKDLAVLKLLQKPKNLTPLKNGNSSKLVVGQKAVAIGNPFGLDHSMSVGTISALNRTIDTKEGIKIYGIIQTDAAINPGNSGGPLINSQGEVIGVNTAIISKSGGNSGVGFAVPIDTVKNTVPDLIKHGKEIHPSLGMDWLTNQQKQRFGIKNGVAIRSVFAGGPAHKAGLKGITRDFYRYYLGDVIIAINDQEVNSVNEIHQTLKKHKIGEEVIVSVIRNRKLYKLRMKLISN